MDQAVLGAVPTKASTVPSRIHSPLAPADAAIDRSIGPGPRGWLQRNIVGSDLGIGIYGADVIYTISATNG